MLFATCLLALLGAGDAHAGKKGGLAGPAASASDIPALADLLDRAGWEPTPELSGVFKPGSVFRADGATHRLMVRSCFDAEEVADTYTSAEVVSQLQAGVKVKLGLGKLEGSGELVKKVKFGAPVHSTLERLAMQPTSECTAMLQKVPGDQLEAMYAVQEVLTAEIAEQTCGRLDASGRFVGIGSAEGELSVACMQESLEPVAVAYRVVPLADLVGVPDTVTIPRPPDVPADCPWGEVDSVSTTVASLAVNGTVYDVRGLEARTEIIDTMNQCGHHEAAVRFEQWRQARRTTNTACATGLGCYPFAIGMAAAFVAKKHKEDMVDLLRTGLTADDRKRLEKQARRNRR